MGDSEADPSVADSAVSAVLEADPSEEEEQVAAGSLTEIRYDP